MTLIGPMARIVPALSALDTRSFRPNASQKVKETSKVDRDPKWVPVVIITQAREVAAPCMRLG